MYLASTKHISEDRISAILSKDPMKTLEFSNGLCGHALRALAFFPEELPDIDMNDVNAVNSIKTDFPEIRQKAKAPSFALQYSGTWVTIAKTLGCSPQKAKEIEMNYKKLYPGLEEFTKKNIEHAQKYGYVKCAFGLKLRTPRLANTYGKELTPEQASEGRSSSNASTQSWGLLMNRALIEFRNIVKTSKFRGSIRFSNTIHDAGYLCIKNDIDVIEFVNTEFIKCMLWQDNDAIRSIEVKMGAELDIGKSWDKQYTLKNNATRKEIQEFLTEHSLLS